MRNPWGLSGFFVEERQEQLGLSTQKIEKPTSVVRSIANVCIFQFASYLSSKFPYKIKEENQQQRGKIQEEGEETEH